MGFAYALYQFGDYLLDPRARTLRGPQGRIAITAKAFDALVFLVEHAGELVERPTLIQSLWPKTIVEDNNLNQTIAALRRALGDGYIATITGRGYQFVAKVVEIPDTETPLAAADVELGDDVAASAAQSPIGEPEPLPTIEAQPVEQHPGDRARSDPVPVASMAEPHVPPAEAQTMPAVGSRVRYARRAGWAALAIVALAIGVVTWLRDAPTGASRAAASVSDPAIPRIAILPFENLSPDPSNAFFTDGLHEEVLTTLANSSPTLEVISRTTMMFYRTAAKPATEIAAELGATHVLSGSVRREGDAVRLSLQLVDARTDGVLMSETYDRTLNSALTLQTEVAQQVAQHLSRRVAGLQLAVARSAAAPTSDARAYDLFLKAKLARQSLNGSLPLEAWLNVESLLNEALARDPKFARAYVARSELRAEIFRSSYDTNDERLVLARADLAAAQRLAPGDPATLAAEARLADDPLRAIELFESAEQAGLADPDLLFVKAGALTRTRRIREGVELMTRLSALDPGNANLSAILWFDLMMIREPTRALQTLAAAAARSSSVPWAPLRAHTLFAFTGNTEPLVPWSDPAIVRQALAGGGQDPGDALRNVTDRLVLLERYREARDVIDSVPFQEIRFTLFSYFVVPPGLRQMPTADMRGWTNLLLGDAAEAANDGRHILAFLERTPAAPAAQWFRLALRADAHTFLGEHTAATADARSLLDMTEAAQNDPNVRVVGEMLAARVLAWTGERDAAIELLERLAVDEPGLPPADVVRDPRYSVPLRDEPRFRALAARLEQQMAATRLP